MIAWLAAILGIAVGALFSAVGLPVWMLVLILVALIVQRRRAQS